MDDARRAKKREYDRRWRIENRDKVNAYERTRGDERKVQWRRDNFLQSILLNCKASAKKRGHGFELTLEILQEMFAPMRCSVTGVELSVTWDGPGRNPWYPSVDRIDASKGYEPGNVRPVCWAYNCARQTWPDEVVLAWATSMLGQRIELV